MAESKKAEFNGYTVEIKKIGLKDANVLFPFVAAAMTKMSLGNFNFFSEIKTSDLELVQEKMCQNILILKDNHKTSDGGVKKNLTLSDLDDCVEGFLPLLVIFLEFNFGFFSLAQKILDPILQQK